MSRGWILYKHDPQNSYESNRLVEEFKKESMDIDIINPNDIDIFVNKENKQSILVNGESKPLPKFVIARTGSGTTYFIKAVIRHLERMGVILINGSEAIENVKDKLYTQQILAESNLNIPKTMLLKHPIDVDFVKKNLGFPVVVKSLSGSFGARVFLAETKKQFEQLLKMAQITNSKFNIIIQEFIKDSFGKDLRVFVVNNKIVGCMMRQAPEGEFRANIHRGGEGIPYETNEEIDWLALESAKLMGLDIAGVDLLFDNGGYKICEVNSSPGFKGLESCSKKNIAGEIVSYVKFRLGLFNE